MEKKEQLYEGKAKKVYATEDPNLVIVSYKDDATAFDGAKKGTIVGKGVIKALRAAYPGANIVAVDYDPGASEVNQLNRIKLMLTAAQRALHAQEATPKKPQPPEAPSISLPHPKVAML